MSEGTMIGSDYDDSTKLIGKKVSYWETVRKLQEDKAFAGKFLVWLPYDEYGGIDEINPHTDGWIKENYIRNADILGSSRKKQIEFFLWKSDLDGNGEPKFSEEKFIQWFGSPIPCIKGSDSHSASDIIGKLKDSASQPIEKYCWIKADPTFEGLNQIVYEPSNRVKIQKEKPEQKIPYSVIESVRFVDNSTAKDFSDQWIDLNPNLNSIIGGKSSGKSLLLYHMAKTIDEGRISEVNKDRGHRKLEYPFEAQDGFDFEVRWMDGESYRLKDSTKPNRQITFIPQLYLNRLAEDKKTELNQLVEEMLLESDSKYKEFRILTSETIDKQKAELSINIEEYYRLKQILLNKEKELNELGDRSAIEKNLTLIRDKIEELKLESKFSDAEEKDYSNLQSEIDGFKEKIKELGEVIQLLEYGKEKLLSAKSRIGEILTSEILAETSLRFSAFSHERVEELTKILDKIEESVTKDLDQKIETEFKLIEERRKDLTSIEDKKKDRDEKIKPFEDKITNRKAFLGLQEDGEQEEKKLKRISDKDKEIEALKKGIGVNTFFEKYEALFQSYVSIVEENETVAKIPESDHLDLTSEVKMKDDEFESNYLAKINKKKSLQGQFGDFFMEEGSYDFDDTKHLSNVRAMVDKIVQGQVEFNRGFSEEQVIRSLLDDYFFVDYDLLQDGDRLLSMSPGKMGIILFQLFLHLSKSQNPILIDQPEDNLDNRTVYQELNDFIKEKKTGRQIIIVSHNANLVVSTDSENVIVANQRGQGSSTENENYQFEYVNGALENTFSPLPGAKAILPSMGIREHVCEILEGGREAFEKREHKYGFR